MNLIGIHSKGPAGPNQIGNKSCSRNITQGLEESEKTLYEENTARTQLARAAERSKPQIIFTNARTLKCKIRTKKTWKRSQVI